MIWLLSFAVLVISNFLTWDSEHQKVVQQQAEIDRLHDELTRHGYGILVQVNKNNEQSQAYFDTHKEEMEALGWKVFLLEKRTRIVVGGDDKTECFINFSPMR